MHAGVGAVAPSGNGHASAGGAVGAGIGFNDRQRREAFLGSQLPKEFPIDGWENLSTKQQLHAMKYSGLNDQEQWELLNPSTSLNTLASYNAQKADAINKTVNASAIRNSAAFRLNFELNRNSQNPSNPSKLPSIQGLDSDARMRYTNVIEELAAQILGRDRLAPTPNPSESPLPQPGPTPIATPEISNNNTQPMKSALIDLSFRDKQLLLGLLNMNKSLLSENDQKRVEFIERQVQNGKVTLDQLNRYYEYLLPIRQKAEKTEWINDQKSSSDKSTTWGSELINNQKDYTSVPGSFGIKGNMQGNACGYMAINNANQFLGYHTDYGDTSYHLNNHSEFTTLADGQLGMNPLVVGAYYRSLGCQVKCYSNVNPVPKTYDAYIMLYFYKSRDKNGNDTMGAHYIAVSYNPSTDKFTGYNNNDETIEQEDSFFQFLPPDQRGYFVWGINNPDQPQNIDTDPSGSDVRY